MKAASPELMSSIAVPTKLLTVIQLIPTLHSGGAERSALEIARALVQAGHRSVVISAGGRLVRQLLAEGSTPVGGSPEQAAQYVKAEHARWGAAVREAGVRPE